MKKLTTIFLYFFWILTAQGQAIVGEETDKSSFIPSGNASVSNPISNIRIFSSKGESRAALNLGLALGERFSGNVEISSPLSKTGFTRPASLDGLASDGKISLGFQYKGWRPLTARAIMAVLPPGVVAFSDLTRAQKRTVLRTLSMPNPGFFGVTSTINKQNFEFATDQSLSVIEEEEEYTFSASFYGGIYFGRSLNNLLRATVLIRNSFQPNRGEEFLIPFNNTNTLVRRDIIVGAPVKQDGVEIKMENVSRFGPALGINPSITYRTEESDIVFDLPIYFIRESDEDKILDFNGGIFFNLVSEGNDPFTFGLFIGTSLSDILGVN